MIWGSQLNREPGPENLGHPPVTEGVGESSQGLGSFSASRLRIDAMDLMDDRDAMDAAKGMEVRGGVWL
jgi:hypothetical protein